MQRPIQYNQFPTQPSNSSSQHPWDGDVPRMVQSPDARQYLRRPDYRRWASDLGPSRLSKRPIVLVTPLPRPQRSPSPRYHPSQQPSITQVLKREPNSSQRESPRILRLPQRAYSDATPRRSSPRLLQAAHQRARSNTVPEVVNLGRSSSRSSTKRDLSDHGSDSRRSPNPLPSSRQVIRRNPEKFRPLPKVGGKTRVGKSMVRLDNEVIVYGRDGVTREGLAISPSQMS